jgi:predicted ATPase
MIQTLAVSGYRSLRDLVLHLGQLNLVTGANGTGKSSLTGRFDCWGTQR